MNKEVPRLRMFAGPNGSEMIGGVLGKRTNFGVPRLASVGLRNKIV